MSFSTTRPTKITCITCIYRILAQQWLNNLNMQELYSLLITTTRCYWMSFLTTFIDPGLALHFWRIVPLIQAKVCLQINVPWDVAWDVAGTLSFINIMVITWWTSKASSIMGLGDSSLINWFSRPPSHDKGKSKKKENWFFFNIILPPTRYLSIWIEIIM